jgi:cytochrome c
MCKFTDWAAACAAVTVLVLPAKAGTLFPGVGRPATPSEIAAWDIDVRPDFKGLPPGSGSVAQGQKVWDDKCASCHGTFGESNEVFTPLVGGTTAEDIRTGRVKSLTASDQGRTTLMKVATISTLWDYINRAMPWNAPKTLTHDEVYAVLAYLLNLGDILPADFVLSERNIAEVQQKLPNRNGMTRSHGLRDVAGKPDVANVACMKDCPVNAALASQLPDYAQGAHGDLAAQQRTVGTRAAGGAQQAAAAAPASDMTQLAGQKSCLACHAVDKRIVGPSFKEVATRYKGEAGAEAKLIEKLKRGGSGAWGQVPMPPNPDLSEQDARALIRWVIVGTE